MILPTYKEIFLGNTKSEAYQIIQFDKVSVRIYGDAKYSRTEMTFSINPGYRRRNVDLSFYINAINDYFISHPCYKQYEKNRINVFDFQYVKFLTFRGLVFRSNEFQMIQQKYPHLLSVRTEKCTIYKEASIGSLNCNYHDSLSDVLSLDSFDGFSGESLFLQNTHIVNENQNLLHLNSVLAELRGIDINYERFFLTTTAPNLRKLVICRKPMLNDQELLFISGFYNLESIQIGAILSSYEQIEKLEKLREIQKVFCSDEQMLAATRKKREHVCQLIADQNGTEKQLKSYLMAQRMLIQNHYQDLRHKLSVSRPERVQLEGKLFTRNLEEIREELIQISNMTRKERKNMGRERREYTLFDSMNGLDFDQHSKKQEEDVLVDSSPFDDGGIQYYVKVKRLILDDE